MALVACGVVKNRGGVGIHGRGANTAIAIAAVSQAQRQQNGVG